MGHTVCQEASTYITAVFRSAGTNYILPEQDEVLAEHVCKHAADLSGKEANGTRRVKTELTHREDDTKRHAPSSNCREPRKLMRI